MTTVNLICWNCGAALPDVPLPVGRGEECPKCVSSIRACRMCRFYDPDASNDCRETMADVVADKEAANTCDYFSPSMPEQARDDDEARQAQAKLDAVFGKDTAGTGEGATDGGGLAGEAESMKDKGETEAEAARRKLDAVFSEDTGGRDSGGKED